MKILVTGGTGYIGSHTCVELLKKGYDARKELGWRAEYDLKRMCEDSWRFARMSFVE